MTTPIDRAALARCSDAISLLPVPGCHDLATALERLTMSTEAPGPDDYARLTALADQVRHRLLADASPDRWLPELVDIETEMDMIAALVAERTAQAELVAIAACALRRASDALPA